MFVSSDRTAGRRAPRPRSRARAARCRCPCRCAGGSTPIPARYQCGPGTRDRARMLPRRLVRRRGTARARRAEAERRRDSALAAPRPTRNAGRPGGNQRAAPTDRSRRRPDVGRRSRSKPIAEEPRQRAPAARARPARPSHQAGVVVERAREHLARLAEPAPRRSLTTSTPSSAYPRTPVERVRLRRP